MGIEWTDEAVETAIKTFMGEYGTPNIPASHSRDMRAALDAAIKAQFERQTDIAMLYAWEAGRAEALEEAAKVARDCAIYDANDRLLNSDIRATCAAAIRALKDTDKPVPADYT